MRDREWNRLRMFQTATGILNDEKYKPIWHEQRPLIFTAKVTAIEQAIADFESVARQQETNITGSAADKRREETELEQAAHLLGGALAIWYRDQNNLEDAAKVDMTITDWRKMRDEQLLGQARLLEGLATAVVSGPDAASAADYGVDAAEVALLKKEADDYEAVITAPQQSQASRAAMTRQIVDRANGIERQFEELDRLILQYRRHPNGPDFIAAYQSARVIRDLGVRHRAPSTDSPEDNKN
ncbi:MAG: hypothetical protein KDA59_25455 [Planctomycetales bacterium]|nr:hypothetical protein [Planctomycetales bacterium]MCA9220805.1 hypothetical protein [Planctomycetales bacterium]